MEMPFYSIHYVKDYHSPLTVLNTHFQSQLTYFLRFMYRLLSCFIHQFVCSDWAITWFWSLEVSIKFWNKCDSSQLVLFQDFFSFGLLNISGEFNKFQNVFFYLCKAHHWAFVRNCNKSVSDWSAIDLSNKSSNPWKRNCSPLFISSLISYSNVFCLLHKICLYVLYSSNFIVNAMIFFVFFFRCSVHRKTVLLRFLFLSQCLLFSFIRYIRNAYVCMRKRGRGKEKEREKTVISLQFL